MKVNVKLYIPIQQQNNIPISHIVTINKTINLPTSQQPYQIPTDELWQYITTVLAKYKPIMLVSFQYQANNKKLQVINCTVNCQPQPLPHVLSLF